MTADPGGERGSALLGVMLFAGLAALTMSVLVGRVVVEYHAVEDSVAQTRAYWAAMGFNNYVLSRTAISGACKPGCTTGPTDYSPLQKTYLTEIADMQKWYYLDVGTSYMIQLISQVCRDAYAPSGAVGEVVIKTSFAGNSGPAPPMPPCPTVPTTGKAPATCAPATAPDPKTIEALRTLKSSRPVEFRYCLVGPVAATCGAGPLYGTIGGRQLVTSVHRPAC